MRSAEGHLSSIVVGVNPHGLLGEFGLPEHVVVVARGSALEDVRPGNSGEILAAQGRGSEIAA